MQTTSALREDNSSHSAGSAVSAAAGQRPTQKPRYLLGPTMDMLLIGGASLLFFAVAYLFVDRNASIDQISWTAFYLAFIVNNPHFMASYLLLYWDKRSELLSNKRFLWAGVIAPGLILGYLAYGIANGSPQLLSYAVNLMYLTVGWHYVKQIYGTMMVTNARQGYFLSNQESWMLRCTLYPVWFMSFLSSNIVQGQYMHYGIGYKTWSLPGWTLMANYWLVGASLCALALVFGRKWIREGKLPAASSMIALASIYVWYLPHLYHAVFWYMIPFFHSLQYMLFVIALKKNETKDQAGAFNDPVQGRTFYAKKLGFFFASIGILAYLTFSFIPETMDKYVAYDRTIFGPQLFAFCFITFINIHHYFIDNVIWRRDNQALKRYL